MTTSATDLNLFGLDLGRLPSFVRQGWEEALRWPLFSWLSPQEAVRVEWPDGTERVCIGSSTVQARPGARPAFHALVLPADSVLAGELRLPHLAEAEIDGAVRLHLMEISPFPIDQVVWGWRIDGVDDTALRVTLAFAARRHVEAFLEERGRRTPDSALEIWADVGSVVVLRGYGERARTARMRSRRGRTVVLLATTIVLALALVATPLWQMRLRVFDARQQLDQLQAASASIVQARTASIATNQKAAAIRRHLDERVRPTLLLKTLTELFPDTAYVLRLDLDGRTARVSGLAADAAALMEALRANPGFSEVRALSPITRGRDGKDSFSLEFAIRPSGGAQ